MDCGDIWLEFGGRRRINAHSLRQRALRRLRRMSGAIGVKSHEVHFVRTGVGIHKRIRFLHASEAIAVERALVLLGKYAGVPALVVRYGTELWLEYVHGEVLDPLAAGSDLLPHFFAELYRRGSRTIETASSGIPAQLREDIEFLQQTGYLEPAVCRRLLERAVELEPERVWLGFEYIDPLPKNFIVRDGMIVGVDVEALKPDTLLGVGPAKAFLRWYREPARDFLERLGRAGAPDISEQLEYAELCFRCTYAKQKAFQRKTHLAPPSSFDRFLA
jgi:hypothetical protein